MATFWRAPSLDSIASTRIGGNLNSCAICFEDFRNPKVLPCLHTFCYECIRRHYEIYKLRNREKLSCPSCREMIPLPPKGIASLKNDPVSVQIKGLLRRLPLPLDGTRLGSNSEAMGSCDDKQELLGARGGSEAVEASAPMASSSQIDELKMYENALQDALVKLRSKALHMYTYECHVHVAMATKTISNNEPTLSRLNMEQDRLYQKIGDVRSVHDVIEDLLQKGTTDLIVACYSLLSSCAQEALSKVEQGSGPVGGAGASAGAVNPWLSEFQAVMFDIGAVGMSSPDGGTIAKKRSALPPYLTQPVKKSTMKEGPPLLFKIGALGSEPGNFDFPTHATFMPTGDILVCDKNNMRLQVFNELGQLKREFLAGHLKPRRARVNPINGLLYVSDELKQAVKVFGPKGDLIRSIGDKDLQCPSGLDFDNRGNVVVTDSEKNLLAIFSPEGETILLTSFRVPGERGRMPDPCYVAVNGDNQMVLADMRNNRVKVLSSTGQVLFKIGNLGCPRGVCVDPHGNILIAEGDKHRVSMYSPDGKFLRNVLEKEHGLKYPMSLDMDRTGQRLMVTQCGFFSPHEVLVFKMSHRHY